MLGLILGNLLLRSLLSKAPGETCGPDVPSVRASRSDWLQAPFSWAAQGTSAKLLGPLLEHHRASPSRHSLAVSLLPWLPQQSHTAHRAGDKEHAFRSKDQGFIWAVGKTLGHHPGTLSQNGNFTRTPFFSPQGPSEEWHCTDI